MKMPASLNYNVDKGGNITQTQYRWAFVCVDALTKVAWIYPIEQLPNREAMQGTGQERTKGAHSPQATQTMDGFQKFVHRINRTREQYWATQMDKWEAEVESKYLQNLEQSEVKDSLVGGAQPLEKPKELKPVLITHDNGAEFGGTKQEGGWQPNIRDLREKYQGKYYKETITPIGRSQYNSIAERFIRTIRRYFHTRYQQHLCYKSDLDKPQQVPHIRAKTSYLKNVPLVYVHILIKNYGPSFIKYGKGDDLTIADKNLTDWKWKIREMFNPKGKVNKKPLSSGITHNHVIHVTDTPEDCVDLCYKLLKKKPVDFENKVINGYEIPWHLPNASGAKLTRVCAFVTDVPSLRRRSGL